MCLGNCMVYCERQQATDVVDICQINVININTAQVNGLLFDVISPKINNCCIPYISYNKVVDAIHY